MSRTLATSPSSFFHGQLVELARLDAEFQRELVILSSHFRANIVFKLLSKASETFSALRGRQEERILKFESSAFNRQVHREPLSFFCSLDRLWESHDASWGSDFARKCPLPKVSGSEDVQFRPLFVPSLPSAKLAVARSSEKSLVAYTRYFVSKRYPFGFSKAGVLAAHSTTPVIRRVVLPLAQLADNSWHTIGGAVATATAIAGRLFPEGDHARAVRQLREGIRSREMDVSRDMTDSFSSLWILLLFVILFQQFLLSERW